MKQLNFYLCYISAPTDQVFEIFKKRFDAIPKDNLRLWTWPPDTQPRSFLYSKALEAREFCKRILAAKQCGNRDDYQEICELIIKFTSGEVCCSYNLM